MNAIPHTLHRKAIILRIGMLLVASYAALPVENAFSFCNQNTAFGIAQCPGNTGGHRDIILNGLNFLRPSVADEIIAQQIATDIGGVNNPEFHFDNSQFTASVNRINTLYSSGVVPRLNPNAPNPVAAAASFGQLLHTAEDFYSHSNWVDYDPTNVPLFDSGSGAWTVPTPYGIKMRGTRPLYVIEGLTPPPEITSFTITSNGTTVTRMVTVNGGPQDDPVGEGLVSGTYGNAGILSPPAASIPHDGPDATAMHKDDNTRTNHAAAFNAAASQTRHEWNRLLSLTHATQGFAGTSIAMALMLDPARSFPPATATVGQVNVSVTKIKVIDDTDTGIFGAGDMNFTFSLYSNDYKSSVRNEVHSLQVESGNDVPAGNLPGPLSLNVLDFKDAVITLQAWDDDNTSSSFDGVLDSSDTVLRGASLDFSNMPFLAKSYTLTTTQLEVTFLVSAVPEPASWLLAILGLIVAPRVLGKQRRPIVR